YLSLLQNLTPDAEGLEPGLDAQREQLSQLLRTWGHSRQVLSEEFPEDPDLTWLQRFYAEVFGIGVAVEGDFADLPAVNAVILTAVVEELVLNALEAPSRVLVELRHRPTTARVDAARHIVLAADPASSSVRVRNWSSMTLRSEVLGETRDDTGLGLFGM